MAGRVFATCWLFYAVFWTPYIVREHFPAIALAERGSLNVDRYVGWSDDIFPGPKGGAYINNNPGASLLGAVPLILLRPVLARIDDWNQTQPAASLRVFDEPILIRMTEARRQYYFLLVAFLTVALVMAPVTAFVAAYLCLRLSAAGVSIGSAAKAGVLLGIGTPIFFRAAHLNHNLLVCDAGFLAMLLVWDAKNRPLRLSRAILAGLLSGFALLCDYSGVVVIVVVGAYVLARAWRIGNPPQIRRMPYKHAAAFAASVLPLILGLLIYQQWAFGSFYHPSQHFMTPTAPTARGYRGMDWPSPALLWANFFDSRFGLFAYCPALLLAFAAPFTARVSFRVPRRETFFLFAYFALFVLFCACNRYSWLQPLTGFRYLVPVVPMLFLLALQAAPALPRFARLVVVAASLIQSLVMAAGHQNTLIGNVRRLWSRHFELSWMVRLGDLGINISWMWPAAAYTTLVIATVCIWTPVIRARATASLTTPNRTPNSMELGKVVR